MLSAVTNFCFQAVTFCFRLATFPSYIGLTGYIGEKVKCNNGILEDDNATAYQGGGTPYILVYIYPGQWTYMCLPFGVYFHEIWYIDGFPSLTQYAQFAKLGVFFWNFANKPPNLAQIRCYSAEISILKGPKIVLFIGMVNGDFSESDRHIHVQNLGKNSLLPDSLHKMLRLTLILFHVL